MARKQQPKPSSSPRKRGSSDFPSTQAKTLDSRFRGNDEQKQLGGKVAELHEHAFSDLYEMSSGISSTPAQAGHGAPFLSFSAVFNNYFLPDVLPDLMDTSLAEQETYSVKEGDIFLTRTSETVDELGMSSVAIKDYPCATFSGFLKRLRPTASGQTDPKFMAFYLRSPLFRKTMTNNAVMVLRASLNEQIFSYLKLLLPDFDTQTRIGEFLYLLNAKIDLNNRINAELEALAKTIYDYWFVQFDFPDAKGRPYKSSGGKMVWNDALKREIPAGWEVKSLSELGSFRNGINYDPSIGGEAVARIVNVRNVSASAVFLKHDDLDELALDQADIDKYLVTADSILIARSGIPGATRMMSPCPPNTIYCGFIICLTVADTESKLLLFFRLKQLEQSLLSQSSGSILKNVSQDTLKEVRLAMPHEGLIAARFNAAIAPLFSKISANDLENRKLTQLRDWLLPLLMNGQVRVA
ncbi:MAG: restriction endonuclease subunit S [Pseudoxanthomonas sp.]